MEKLTNEFIQDIKDMQTAAAHQLERAQQGDNPPIDAIASFMVETVRQMDHVWARVPKSYHHDIMTLVARLNGMRTDRG